MSFEHGGLWLAIGLGLADSLFVSVIMILIPFLERTAASLVIPVRYLRILSTGLLALIVAEFVPTYGSAILALRSGLGASAIPVLELRTAAALAQGAEMALSGITVFFLWKCRRSLYDLERISRKYRAWQGFVDPRDGN